MRSPAPTWDFPPRPQGLINTPASARCSDFRPQPSGLINTEARCSDSHPRLQGPINAAASARCSHALPMGKLFQQFLASSGKPLKRLALLRRLLLRLQAEGLIHTSPGQRPGFPCRVSRLQANGLLHKLSSNLPSGHRVLNHFSFLESFCLPFSARLCRAVIVDANPPEDRKSTRLNSSHRL